MPTAPTALDSENWIGESTRTSVATPIVVAQIESEAASVVTQVTGVVPPLLPKKPKRR